MTEEDADRREDAAGDPEGPPQTALGPPCADRGAAETLPENRGWRERLPDVVLPDGYRGKILLVLISVGGESLVALRSGDLWHREILRNARAEIDRLGLKDAQVNELGGAWLCFEEDGSIRIWGGSDEFGACDLDHAAALVRSDRPGCAVVVCPGEMP